MNFNSLIVWLLRSPFHRLLSRSTLVLGVKGLKSGRTYDVPVNFVSIEQESGQRILVSSQRDRTWWRNLRTPVEIDLTYQGRTRKAIAQVQQDEGKVAEGFRQYFQASPRSARYFGVSFNEAGDVDSADLDRLVRERVMIVIEPVATSP